MIFGSRLLAYVSKIVPETGLTKRKLPALPHAYTRQLDVTATVWRRPAATCVTTPPSAGMLIGIGTRSGIEQVTPELVPI